MSDNEKSFFNLCKKYSNAEINDFKGLLLYKAYRDEKYGEELLASYIAPKSKFDSIYAFILTKTRLIEINVFSTMAIVSTKSFKYINKVVVEQEFDDKKMKDLLKDEALPERIQLKIQFIDLKNELDEISWEKIEESENVEQAISFAKKLREIQVNSQSLMNEEV